MKPLIIAALLLISAPQAAWATSTEISMVEACLGFWKNITPDENQYDQMQPRIRKMCECQVKEVFKAGLAEHELAALEKFMAGGAPLAADLEKSGLIFNQSSPTCEKAAME